MLWIIEIKKIDYIHTKLLATIKWLKTLFGLRAGKRWRGEWKLVIERVVTALTTAESAYLQSNKQIGCQSTGTFFSLWSFEIMGHQNSAESKTGHALWRTGIFRKKKENQSRRRNLLTHTEYVALSCLIYWNTDTENITNVWWSLYASFNAFNLLECGEKIDIGWTAQSISLRQGLTGPCIWGRLQWKSHFGSW